MSDISNLFIRKFASPTKKKFFGIKKYLFINHLDDSKFIVPRESNYFTRRKITLMVLNILIVSGFLMLT